MNESDHERIDTITTESIERLYKINKIRTVLEKNANVLNDLDVNMVVVFGSVINGIAYSNSDIDLCFILRKIGHDDDDWDEKPKMSQNLTEFIKQEFSSISRNLVIENGESENKSDIQLHIWFQFSGKKVPPYAADNIVLWKNKTPK